MHIQYRIQYKYIKKSISQIPDLWSAQTDGKEWRKNPDVHNLKWTNITIILLLYLCKIVLKEIYFIHTARMHCNWSEVTKTLYIYTHTGIPALYDPKIHKLLLISILLFFVILPEQIRRHWRYLWNYRKWLKIMLGGSLFQISHLTTEGVAYVFGVAAFGLLSPNTAHTHKHHIATGVPGHLITASSFRHVADSHRHPSRIPIDSLLPWTTILPHPPCWDSTYGIRGNGAPCVGACKYA